ncbi:UvrB/UvrC motif-containing protein [Patescibacteria group bacterium]|nr:UvrB/UvrC motif-containing protein [Patescibacteria group bacterium]
MLWANFLHFYQPARQQPDILERIVNESYRKIIQGLKENSKAKMTININGCLTESLIKYDYLDVIDDFKKLAENGQIEFTGSAKYHPFLALLPEKEIERQIKINTETNKKYFGEIYNPQGFFIPELAYSFKVAQMAQKLNFEWVIAEQLACPSEKAETIFNKIYQIKNLDNFKILFRDKKVSILILSAIIRSTQSLLGELGDEIKKNRYLLTVMDAETFGHHRPGLENFLFEIYKNKTFEKVFISDLLKKFSVKEELEPRESTWSSEEQDFWLDREKKFIQTNPFSLWNHPENPIHKLQWEFTYWVINFVNILNPKESWYFKIRNKLDVALASDQYWWASAKPWWSLEMIEQGAFALRDVIWSIPKISQGDKNKADEFYQKILNIAFEWQRTGKIRTAYKKAYKTIQRKPFIEETPSDWYNLIILEFEDEMKKAIKKQEFEKAIKWRDAIYKLKAGVDIYDVLHVVDDLRIVRILPSLKSFWEHSLDEFSGFTKEHFKDFDENEFEEQQTEKVFEKIKEAFYQKKEFLEKQKFSQAKHPLGLDWDIEKNIYLCEMPSKKIKLFLGKGWDSASQIKLDDEKNYGEKGQCLYKKEKGQLKVHLATESILNQFYQFLKQEDASEGENMRLAVMSESFGWAPVIFKQKKVKIPYLETKEGMDFKFRISGFDFKKSKGAKKLNLVNKLREFFVFSLGKLDGLIKKIIWKMRG